jgi:starch synthase
MFLMPSQYEPCGLNQLYSLRYGTVPIVHAVGGLVDTVVGITEATLNQRTATGFAFYHYDIESLIRTTDQAVDLYLREKDVWSTVVETGMRQDWSWGKSAERYEEVYHQIVNDKKMF